MIDAAEAMPEEKFNFTPESLNIPGADYKGVRTFALQVRHVAASNYILWARGTVAALVNGRVPADERNRPAGQPGKVRLTGGRSFAAVISGLLPPLNGRGCRRGRRRGII